MQACEPDVFQGQMFKAEWDEPVPIKAPVVRVTVLEVAL